jgi:hypothetical protein
MSSNAKAEQPLSLYCGAARESSNTAASWRFVEPFKILKIFNRIFSVLMENIRFPITVYITL